MTSTRMGDGPTAPDPDRAAAVRAYADAVAGHLADLPDAERADLVDDLQEHLAEIAAEGEESLVERLGDPAAYATELRASAGLPDAPASGAGMGRRRERTAARDAARAAFVRAVTHPAVRPVVTFLPELRPAWWVMRAVLLVVLAALVVGGAYSPGARFTALLLAAVAVVASVRAGRAARDDRPGGPARRLGVRAADAVGGLFAGWIGLMLLLGGLPSTVEYVPVDADQQLVTLDQGPGVIAGGFLHHPDGEPITNIHAYDAQGNPVEGVFLYDGVGRPIEVAPREGLTQGASALPDLETDYERAADGTPLTNRYPLEQYVVSYDDDGTPRRRPRPAPDVVVPGAGAADARSAAPTATDAESITAGPPAPVGAEP